MRLIVIGTPRQRRDLRERIDASLPDVVGEFESLAAARESGIQADALVLAPGMATGAHDGDSPPIEALTPREIAVLELVAEGLANKAIARRLGISDQTVKFHVASLAGKLGAANRTDAVRRAVRHGLITL
jgi:two-component system, NarL family, response regulator YdfI